MSENNDYLFCHVSELQYLCRHNKADNKNNSLYINNSNVSKLWIRELLYQTI